ncbi:MAG: GAF domain-containing protein [Chromatiales bacterium]|jgi:transcriptional regulator with GAF, ATPase, and Fis domain|nr:GAF domain-containing protein [Chromatiales bacterium]
MRLDTILRAWTADNYESLLRFYVLIIPKLLNAERCGIFVLDTVRARLLSKVGTGLHEGQIDAPLEGSLVGQVVSTGQRLVDNALDGRSGFHQTLIQQTCFVTRSVICSPIRSVAAGRIIGALQVLNKCEEHGFGDADVAMVDEVSEFLAMALDNIVVNDEIKALSSDLDKEVCTFQRAFLADHAFIAESAAMRSVLDTVRMVGATPVNVVIQGENGTG